MAPTKTGLRLGPAPPLPRAGLAQRPRLGPRLSSSFPWESEAWPLAPGLVPPVPPGSSPSQVSSVPHGRGSYHATVVET